MDLVEPHWRTNSSYSPPIRRWDCRFHSDGLPHGSNEVTLHGSSVSSHSKGSRSRVSSDHYTNHHHSVSDGALSYCRSPSANFQPPRWTPPLHNSNFGEFATPSVGGSRSETTLFPPSAERLLSAGTSAASNCFGSPCSLPETGQWEPSSKQPSPFSHRNFSNRRSFMSKPVYPLVFQNPVSDGEPLGYVDMGSIGRLTPCEDRSTQWPGNSSNIEQKFHRTLTELQKMETSPEPSSMSSRREGFRWSNASSCDLGFDGESFDIAEHVDTDNHLRSPKCPSGDQKCGLCGRLLRQKSPCGSYRIIRGNDMPIAAVLPCSHIFHAECLEETTPKTQIHDPPCPFCLKTIGSLEESSSVSEPLQLALRSLQRNRGLVISEADETGLNNPSPNYGEGGLRRNRSLQTTRRNGSGSLIKHHLKKHFTFNGKMGKGLFSTKIFGRVRPSSNQDLARPLRSVGASRK